MIVPCDNEKIDVVFDYIAKDYGRCLYIFIDLKKYGLDDPNFDVWIQYNENNEICAIISEYYGGIQLYSKDYDFIPSEIADFIKEKDTHVLFGMIQIIDKLKEFLPDYSQETGIVGELKELKYPPNPKAYSIPLEEMEEVVKVVAADEDIGKPYGFESLYEQYCERKKTNFGRNFVLRADNGDIICHAGTYAELEELAVIGGVITAPNYRGKGFSKETLSSLCKELQSEDKDIFSFYYVPPAKKMHEGVGFKPLGEWSKLMKNE
ncbi:MAG: GNAT family N-acetyltransferase [Methanobacteriaceae archaeon]|nr:GNAT family N-acetyltransferase [Methanobacteriaceae archaeon]